MSEAPIFDDDVLDELPAAVAESIASWRNIFANRRTDDVAGLLRNAARDLFNTRKVGKTVWPESDGITNQAIVDALADMAQAAGINADDAQLIFAKAQREEPPTAINGVSVIDEPPPPASLDEYGTSSEPVIDPNKPPRFVPVAIDDVQINTEPAWLIHRILPARGLAFIVGPPKCGKSFLTTDLLFSVARSAPYAGRETLGGPVIYLTAEGVTGFKRRLVAIRRHYGVEGEGVPFFMIGNVPDLGSEQTDIDVLIRDLERFITAHGLEQPRAIALDTLARCMGTGDENTARDMGRFINRCGLIERRFSCVVPVVHHVGKNPAQGGRGSNAQNGAADVTITVEKNEGYSTVRIDEMKDGPEGQEWRFRLVPFDLGEASKTPTEALAEATTCIVELLSEPTQAKQSETKSRKPVRGVNGDLLKVIRRAIDETGQRDVASDLVPPQVAAIDRSTLKNYCKIMAWQDQDSEPDSFRNVLNRSLKALRAIDAIGFTQDWIWLT